MAALGVKGLLYVCDVAGERVCVDLSRLLGLKCACWARLEVMLSGLKIQETGLGDSMNTVRAIAELVWAETLVCLLHASTVPKCWRRMMSQVFHTHKFHRGSIAVSWHVTRWRCCRPAVCKGKLPVGTRQAEVSFGCHHRAWSPIVEQDSQLDRRYGFVSKQRLPSNGDKRREVLNLRCAHVQVALLTAAGVNVGQHRCSLSAHLSKRQPLHLQPRRKASAAVLRSEAQLLKL